MNGLIMTVAMILMLTSPGHEHLGLGILQALFGAGLLWAGGRERRV